jgi:hypothetical protein
LTVAASSETAGAVSREASPNAASSSFNSFTDSPSREHLAVLRGDHRWNGTAQGWAEYAAQDPNMAQRLEEAERRREQGAR